MVSALELARSLYQRQGAKQEKARALLGRPLCLAEKILFSHCVQEAETIPERGEDMASLRPDRVAMQDATAQMAIMQFIGAGLPQVALPTTVHCDHLIRGRDGAADDLTRAATENGEVYEFLASASRKYGMGFWHPGSGIIHQVVLENYAFPGGLMIGTDSHTPNAGGLGMLAIGVGGADAVDAMVGMPWEVLWPKLIGVKLTGKLGAWVAPKDVILHLLAELTTEGGTGKVIEYFGQGCENLSCTGKATITNMGAELGATCSIFPLDQNMLAYLHATNRTELAELCSKHESELVADHEVLNKAEKFYDEIVEIDLSKLEPGLVGPHTPDLLHLMRDMSKDAAREGYPIELSAALIGSCTNSSYEDLGKAAHIARQAIAKGIRPKVPFFVSPGSNQVQDTTKRDGQLEVLEELGAMLLSNSCGPCIGQWERTDGSDDTENSIVTSFNRNFRGRNDGNRKTLGFIGSPELVTALALAGRLDFNPLEDSLLDAQGQSFKFEAPEAEALPEAGFSTTLEGYEAPPKDGSGVEIIVNKDSERLAFLTPFAAPQPVEDFKDLRVLLKAKGKCTTDHISPAGYWLRYRGHLDKISDNMFSGANNAFTDNPGTSLNTETGEIGKSSDVARDYKARGIGWIAVGDANYGEGSSREHAAMCPRHLAARAVITRSFARIHETNLKKQGLLALTFVDPDDYERIQSHDRVELLGLAELAVAGEVTCVLRHADGSLDQIFLVHSLTEEQIEWFKSGSALNLIRANRGN